MNLERKLAYPLKYSQLVAVFLLGKHRNECSNEYQAFTHRYPSRLSSLAIHLTPIGAQSHLYHAGTQGQGNLSCVVAAVDLASSSNDSTEDSKVYATIIWMCICVYFFLLFRLGHCHWLGEGERSCCDVANWIQSMYVEEGRRCNNSKHWS